MSTLLIVISIVAFSSINIVKIPLELIFDINIKNSNLFTEVGVK
jgi:hypothetical protein